MTKVGPAIIDCNSYDRACKPTNQEAAMPSLLNIILAVAVVVFAAMVIIAARRKGGQQESAILWKGVVVLAVFTVLNSVVEAATGGGVWEALLVVAVGVALLGLAFTRRGERKS